MYMYIYLSKNTVADFPARFRIITWPQLEDVLERWDGWGGKVNEKYIVEETILFPICYLGVGIRYGSGTGGKRAATV